MTGSTPGNKHRRDRIESMTRKCAIIFPLEVGRNSNGSLAFKIKCKSRNEILYHDKQSVPGQHITLS